MIRRKFFYLIVFILSTVFLSSCEKPVDERYVVAKVEDESLTIQALIAEIPPQIRSNLSEVEIREYVLRWINSQVLYHEALEQKFDERLEFQREIEKLKRELLITKLVEQVLNDDVTVTDGEIQAYFATNQEEFRLTEDVVHVYHVLLGTRKEANDVSRRLKAGKSFAAVFSDVSLDSSNNTDDWDLGYFSKDKIAPEISKVVFKLRKGATSLPIKSAFGYHVVQLIDKKKRVGSKTLNSSRKRLVLKYKQGKNKTNTRGFFCK